MGNKVIEDLLWVDVFQNDILRFTLPVVALIAILRVVAQWSKLRQIRPFVYLIKALAYGYLIVMLGVYFTRENALQSINVFTGFTFLFSAVEVVDNLFLYFEEGRNSLRLSDDFWRKQLLKEEENFENMISVLTDLHNSIQPGRVSKSTKKYVNDLLQNMHSMSFYRIDFMLESKKNEKNYFTNILWNVRCSKMIFSIVGNETKKNRGRKSVKSLSFDKKQCEEIKEILNEAINCRSDYYKEKERLTLEKKNMDLVL